MASAPAVLKRSIVSLLQRVPKDEVFHPGYDFAGSLTHILDERIASLNATKLPKYDEDVLKSFEKGIKDITDNKWKNKVRRTPEGHPSLFGSSSHLPPAALAVPPGAIDPDPLLKSHHQLP